MRFVDLEHRQKNNLADYKCETFQDENNSEL